MTERAMIEIDGYVVSSFEYLNFDISNFDIRNSDVNAREGFIRHTIVDTHEDDHNDNDRLIFLAVLGLEGVDDFEKWKTVKIRVSCMDPPNSVFTHQDSGMRVVNQISGQVWELLKNLIGDSGMAVGFNQNPQT
jgi:hypothetical protein